MIKRTGAREEACEILVQRKSGARRVIVQAKGTEVFQPGDPVILITTSGKVRVSRVPSQ